MQHIVPAENPSSRYHVPHGVAQLTDHVSLTNDLETSTKSLNPQLQQCHFGG